MSVKLYKQEWDKSYNRFENHILYPKEEVVKFLNRFVRKKLSDKTFQNKIRVMTRMHNIKGCKFLYDNEKQVC